MDMMSIRRRIMSGQKSGGGLPSGYVQYDYIEATDQSALLNTGVNATSDIVIQFHLYLARANGDLVIGAEGTTESNDFRYFNATSYEYFDIKDQRINHSIGYPPKEVSREVGNLYIKDLVSGETLVSGTAVEAWSISNTIYIGHTNNMLGDKIYFVKIYDGGTLIRDFIPVYSTTDEQYGLFDLAGQAFYGHANFIGGNT